MEPFLNIHVSLALSCDKIERKGPVTFGVPNLARRLAFTRFVDLD